MGGMGYQRDQWQPRHACTCGGGRQQRPSRDGRAAHAQANAAGCLLSFLKQARPGACWQPLLRLRATTAAQPLGQVPPTSRSGGRHQPLVAVAAPLAPPDDGLLACRGHEACKLQSRPCAVSQCKAAGCAVLLGTLNLKPGLFQRPEVGGRDGGGRRTCPWRGVARPQASMHARGCERGQFRRGARGWQGCTATTSTTPVFALLPSS